MRPLLISLRLFVRGVFRRFLWWVPSFLLDPLDLYERFFHRAVEIPNWIFYMAFGAGMFMAALLTFHELRLEGEKAPSAADTLSTAVAEAKDATQAISERLAQFHREGESIRNQILADPAEWSEDWPETISDWRQRLGQYVQDNVSPAKAVYLDSLQSLPDASVFDARGRPVPEHKANLIRGLEARLAKLGDLMRQY